ncbi:conserved hypothetical protein [Leishmania infantum JPCM5]|uniref:SIN1-type PH domain-containing protein n=2 Tax=Leishmania infantum TaxID=5671 RepID=E9AG73_LEIIN|nr:conserved hypothetical protein [Leishmania infantum JPCM5]CAC9448401.1 hypothetical_protein_-_conserved [Leishmania infantum]CBZ08361.1 conserved hypothetical protein [Leishmania infantum JPCM5]SUZ39228.1 hypothetical_protein_-_conserved [Leishmania infantum]|eukprot:XP_003392225.1 conserved hypothetical protein [Leishmania infantum JPCM5]
MMRWAVDVTGIDVAEDLEREQRKCVYKVPRAANGESWHAVDDWRPNASEYSDELGKVWALTRDEVQDAIAERALTANALFRNVGRTLAGALQRQGSIAIAAGCASQLRGGCGRGLQWDGLLSNTQSMASNDFACDAVPSTREVRVFSTFLNAEGKRTTVTVNMTQPTYRGVDVVAAFLQQAVATNESLSQRYSTNPRLYKLFIADEDTGEEEMAAQLDLGAQNFSCYAVNPMPAAKLFLFPQRTALLNTTTRDVNLTVQVRPLDPQAKAVQRQCVVPADMLSESLEATICSRLPASGIIQGSLRIMHGPMELNINEYYNFGAGCGQPNCPIAERTVLSLFRFGVREVVVNGRAVEEAPTEVLRDLTEDIIIDMGVDEAVSFQQFEVICINKYGARQQRLLCVDGEHLYTMRPNASEALPKTTERTIKDIEEVRIFADKPKYMEIAYTKSSHFEEDRFECTTTYNCALLNEKIRIVRRELRKREAEEQAASVKNETAMQRFMTGIRSRWFGGA